MFEKIRQGLESALTHLLHFEERVAGQWRQGTNRRTSLALLSIGVLITFSYLFFVAPPRAFPVDKLIAVPEGASLAQVAADLEKEKVVRSDLALRIMVRFAGRSTSVRAGDYLFKEPKSIFAVLNAITTGDFGLDPKRVRILEGTTVQEMAHMYAESLERVDEQRFIEKAQPLEGYLYPDTYFFLPNATEDTVIRAMRQNFDAKIAAVMEDVYAFGRPVEDIVIMASLLEQEANVFEDRRKIAGVLWRRIDEDMLLQVDAAFLYSIGRTTFDLTSADLKDADDPYNTYVHKGLPPGPIGNPSIEALQAAVTPIDEGNLFYLADRNGITYYSKTYEEHLVKKRRYLGT